MFHPTALWLLIIVCLAVIIGLVFYVRHPNLFDTQVRWARAAIILLSVLTAVLLMVQLAQWMGK